ncbi:MAG: NHL repeat-containing protein [Candidatus Omnitrophota bacterium]
MASIENVKVLGVKYIGGNTLIKSKDNSVYDIDMGPDGRLYIPDFRNNRIIILNSDMEEISSINNVPSPHGLAIDNEGFLYVATYKNGKVLKFDPSGQKISRWGKDLKLSMPVSLDVDKDNNVLIADYGLKTLIKVNKDGEYLVEFDVSRIKEDGDFLPHSVNADSERYIYVADRGKARSIQVFQPDGTHVGTWKKFKDEIDPLAVRSLTPDVLMVSDYASSKIYFFDSQEKYITELGSLGDNPGQFLYATNLISDGRGIIYVVEQDGNRVQKIDLSGLEDSSE